MVKSELLDQVCSVEHFFLEKSDFESQDLFCDQASLVECEQIHQEVCAEITFGGHCVKGADSLISKKPCCLGIRTADCLPIFIYDKKAKAVAAIHAGWRGLLKGVIKEAFAGIKKLGGNPADCLCAIGPHAMVCCYRVGEEVVSSFSKSGFLGRTAKSYGNDIFLDLTKIAKIQLQLLGVRQKCIDVINICTICNNRFFSYRRDGIVPNRANNIICHRG